MSIKIAALAIIPLLSIFLNFSEFVRAELPTNSVKIAEKIARRPFQSQQNNANTSSACENQAMGFLRKGLTAEENGDENQALKYYAKSLQVDDECGYAYLLSAKIIAQFDTHLAIEFGTAGAACFVKKEDEEGLNAAIELLTELGVEF
jgi:tetratricopeptide (TPR) repeat protein